MFSQLIVYFENPTTSALTALALGILIGVFISWILTLIRRNAQSQREESLTNQITQMEIENSFLLQRIDDLNSQVNLSTSRLEQKSHLVIQLQTQQQERAIAHNQKMAQFEEQKKLLTQQFENIAQKIFTQQGAQFSKSQEQSVKILLEPFQQRLGQFSQQVEQFKLAQVTSHASLNTELQHLKQLNQDITREAHTLSRALKGDKKITGLWGEGQLERCLQLAGLQNFIHYERESNFVSNQGQNRRPDFIVKLPDAKNIIIDSKMSLVAYDKAIAAETLDEQSAALSIHCKSIRKHIDELSQKDYSSLIGINSPHFVLMYLAIEPAFIEALKHDNQIYEYGAQKNIILVSNTTLMPILKTISNLWLLERSHSQAFALAERASDIHQQVCLLGERLQKLGRGLQTVTNHFNDSVTALSGKQGLYGKIERFGELAKSGNTPPDVDEVHTDIETYKLRPLVSEHE